jgi:hypothetical protein
MRPIAYSLQFRGNATLLHEDRVRLRLTAPSAALVTTIDAAGIRGAFGDIAGGEAMLEAELTLGGSESVDHGWIEFGHGNSVRFRNPAARLVRCPDPHLEHGGVIREVEGGEGQFAGAEGLITSNFFISDTGDVTENHFGLVFVRTREEDQQ